MGEGASRHCRPRSPDWKGGGGGAAGGSRLPKASPSQLWGHNPNSQHKQKHKNTANTLQDVLFSNRPTVPRSISPLLGFPTPQSPPASTRFTQTPHGRWHRKASPTYSLSICEMNRTVLCNTAVCPAKCSKALGSSCEESTQALRPWATRTPMFQLDTQTPLWAWALEPISYSTWYWSGFPSTWGSFTPVNPGQGTQSLELAASIKAEFKVVPSHFFLYSTLRIFVPITAFGSIWNFISKGSEKQNGKVEEMRCPRHPSAILAFIKTAGREFTFQQDDQPSPHSWSSLYSEKSSTSKWCTELS